MTAILWVLGALAAAAVAEEMLGGVIYLCRRILRRAARRLPLEHRARYAEEWEAELLALPGGPVTKLVWALRTRAGVRALAAALAPNRRRVKAAKPSRAGMRRAKLIDRAQAGDVQAFGDLYDEYALTVYRYIYGRTSSSALAEDLTGETFIQALRALDAFRWQDRDFAGWLERIAKTLVTEQRQR
jgi:hypothetical protein